jgi:hypothetical protein
VSRATAAIAALLLLGGVARAQSGSSDQSQPAPQGPASAPSGQPPAPNSKAPQATGVTVRAKTPDYRSSIDRRSYNLSNDLQAANGSLADALRNVPTASRRRR